jgi:hypothetical protein
VAVNIAVRGRGFEELYGLVHLPPVRVRRAPPVQVGAGTDQREDRVGQGRHDSFAVARSQVVGQSRQRREDDLGRYGQTTVRVAG